MAIKKRETNANMETLSNSNISMVPNLGLSFSWFQLGMVFDDRAFMFFGRPAIGFHLFAANNSKPTHLTQSP